MSRGRVTRGRGGIARYQRRLATELPHCDPDLLNCPSTTHHGSGEPSDPAGDGGTLAGQSEEPSDLDLVEGQTEVEACSRQGKAGGGGRRKAGSAKLGFQYPDVFGRRRTRGGSTAGVGKRRAITSGRINFRHRTAQAQRDDVISGDTGNRPEVSLNTVY